VLVAISAGCHSAEVVAALDRGDVARATTLLESGASTGGEDAEGNSALMLAAWHGDAELVRRVLAGGGDVKHANANGATALHFAVDDAAKVKLLLDAGADPNAADRAGITPLDLAVGRNDDGEVVALMLAHGGDAKRVDGSIGVATPGVAKELLARGTDPKVDEALIVAASRDNTEVMKLLVDRGADVNRVSGNLGFTPLMWAAQSGQLEAVELLLARGADPNVRERFNGATALVQAASSDRAGPAVVRALLDHGADATIADDEGADALAWAIRRGDADIIALVAPHETAPPHNPTRQPHGDRVADNTPRGALLRAIPLLERGRVQFRERAHCPSCHHDALPALAIAAAAAHGLPVDQAARTREAKLTASSFQRTRIKFPEGAGFADDAEPSYLLAGLAASDYPKDAITDAIARYVELVQEADGRFPAMLQRVPADGSDIALTAVSIRALAAYAPEADVPARIARARAYLAKQDATTTEDRTYQLLGLHWAGATAAELAPLAAALVATQRPDGSFAQRTGLRGDAYATGQAIVALREAAGTPASDPAIARAVQFLVTTQITDGSWFVPTRALRFQPFFDSGFPQGRSQYSSALGTSWAVMALADTLGVPAREARGLR
jgi:ankyrin repeat protein